LLKKAREKKPADDCLRFIFTQHMWSTCHNFAFLRFINTAYVICNLLTLIVAPDTHAFYSSV
jgi:hypothetical protein